MCVFPEPVWPYAKMHPLYPFKQFSVISFPKASNMSSYFEERVQKKPATSFHRIQNQRQSCVPKNSHLYIQYREYCTEYIVLYLKA